ncbi:cholinesterase 1 [Scaptodrosophila lebanonensis]|uniref:Carboxylic ester hydrolase n=1 Tax=Drosophila lebanonensis TaxID=7225 RepID=A0A6J2UFK9_DROLE|nr:cholinesterase 1 [Scaptodrosophila lebanonensis]
MFWFTCFVCVTSFAVVQFRSMPRRGLYMILALCGCLSAVLITWIVISSSGTADAQTTEPTITVHLEGGQGAVLGNYDRTSWTQQSFMQFRGVPYAEAPVKKLRFRPPVPRSPWSNTFNGLNYGRRCPVITNLDPLASDAQLEDCLNLCIYTKNLTARQPVMFYVYGGGYYNGSSSDHPPNYLLEHDVVLVVPHYRVGALGWLTNYSQQLPGNAPIADILLALEWVQQHIHVFGGDSQQVTIFGQSAGAGVTSALLLSPRTADNRLFQRAIVQSGSIFAGWAVTKDPSAQAIRICQALGCTDCERNDKILLLCILGASVRDILEATKSESFSPVVGDLQDILPQNPNELVKQYNRKVPLMTGFTQHDGSFVLASYYDGLDAKGVNISDLSVRQLSEGLIAMVNDTTGLTDQLLYRLLYTPFLLQSQAHKEAIPSYFDLTSDIFMKSPVISLATKLHVRQPDAPIYVYSFEYEGAYTRFGYEFGNDQYPFNGGVHHSNDNIYLFATHPLEGEDTRMAQQMAKIWTSFARTGVPQDLNALTSTSGPYNWLGLNVEVGADILETLTATIDDPNNWRLVRT